MFRWLIDRIAEDAAKKATQDYLASDRLKAKLEKVVDEIIADVSKNPKFIFIRDMARRYLERSPKLTATQAWDHARDWLNDFLRSEKIEFGDARYDWTLAGARTLADEDIQYWEVAA